MLLWLMFVYVIGLGLGIWIGLTCTAEEEIVDPADDISLRELYTRVARAADTDSTQINAAITSRVMRVAFDELAALPPPVRRSLIDSGVRLATRRKDGGS